MLAIGKGLIHPLTALKMRKEGLTNIVWPESLANSEAHSDLLFWRVERVVEIHMYICFLLRCLVLNPWYHSEWDGIQQAWLVTFSYFLVGCVRDFETIFWTSEVKMVGVRACGDLVGNCETWKDQCLSGHNMGWKGVFFTGFLKVDSTDGNLSTIPLASTSHLASPSLSKVPDL